MLKQAERPAADLAVNHLLHLNILQNKRVEDHQPVIPCCWHIKDDELQIQITKFGENVE